MQIGTLYVISIKQQITKFLNTLNMELHETYLKKIKYIL